MSTMEAKDNKNRSAEKIKRLAASKADMSDYDRYESAKVPSKKKERTGVLPVRKKQVNKTPNNKGSQRY